MNGGILPRTMPLRRWLIIALVMSIVIPLGIALTIAFHYSGMFPDERLQEAGEPFEGSRDRDLHGLCLFLAHGSSQARRFSLNLVSPIAMLPHRGGQGRWGMQAPHQPAGLYLNSRTSRRLLHLFVASCVGPDRWPGRPVQAIEMHEAARPCAVLLDPDAGEAPGRIDRGVEQPESILPGARPFTPSRVRWLRSKSAVACVAAAYSPEGSPKCRTSRRPW